MGARVCEVGACERGVYARGLCGRHYKQVRRHGEVQSDQVGSSSRRHWNVASSSSEEKASSVRE